MNAGQFQDLTTEAHRTADTLADLLKETRRTNELLEKLAGGGNPTLTGGTADKAPAPAKPWPDYDDLTVGEIITRARTRNVDEAMRNRILAYERANKNRNGVIQPLVNWNS